MKVLGIETSCDECSAAVVENGRHILSNVIHTQIEFHKPYNGVVPEIASRKHTEWILPIAQKALKEASCSLGDIDSIAVTKQPGLVGSLLVGFTFAKGLSLSLGIPFTGVDHILSHLYAPHLEYDIEYPYIGLLVSGGHTVFCTVKGYNNIEVWGTTIDDACGEAFDKVAKHHKLGYPGGVVIDKLAEKGDSSAFNFPYPSLHKGDHEFDVSYSGLKTAVINQLEQFRNTGYEATPENIAASFQKTAIGMIVRQLKKLVKKTGISTVVVGGGVAANSLLRKELSGSEEMTPIFPSMKLCTDNGAMIAGIGYHYLQDGITASLSDTAQARVAAFKRTYP